MGRGPLPHGASGGVEWERAENAAHPSLPAAKPQARRFASRDTGLSQRAVWNRKEELMTPSREKPLTSDEVHARLWQLTAKQFDKGPADLRPELRVAKDLGADSLDVAELGMVLEDELGVVLPDDLLGNPNLTLTDVEQALWERCSGKG